MAGHIFLCGKRVCVEGALVGETHCFLCAGIDVNVDGWVWLGVVGCGWVLLGVVGCCWVWLGVVGCG